MEFVAEEPQPAKIMFSHWWGGLMSRSGDLRKVGKLISCCCLWEFAAHLRGEGLLSCLMHCHIRHLQKLKGRPFFVRTLHGLHAGSGQDDHGPGPEHRRFTSASGSLQSVVISLGSLSLLPRHLHPHLDLHFRELPVRRELWLQAHGPLLLH